MKKKRDFTRQRPYTVVKKTWLLFPTEYYIFFKFEFTGVGFTDKEVAERTCKSLNDHFEVFFEEYNKFEENRK